MSCGIYKFTNLINNQVYIGQSINIEQRYKQHKTNCHLPDRNQSKFYQALNEFGIDNFSFEILELCEPDQLNDKEIYWINYYDAVNAGYNTLSGGSYGYIVDRQLIFDAWNEGLSIQKIAEKLDVCKTTVRNALHGYDKYSVEESHKRGGQMAFETALSNQSHNSLKISNAVYQYDLNGNFIQKYNSVYEAARCTNTQESSIRKVISGERQTANNFIWFKEQQDYVAPRKSGGKSKSVYQLDLNGNQLNEYKSLSEAARTVNGDQSLIGKVCRGVKKTAYGYKWKYSE